MLAKPTPLPLHRGAGGELCQCTRERAWLRQVRASYQALFPKLPKDSRFSRRAERAHELLRAFREEVLFLSPSCPPELGALPEQPDLWVKRLIPRWVQDQAKHGILSPCADNTRKTIYSPAYETFLRLVREARRDAGLTLD